MFDFAVTGKPMLFYVYDFEHYRDELRGFYFDFEPEAPGPLCRTTDEVISVLGDLDASVAACAERYARFRDKYCYLDDGRASARVVEKVFAELLP
jgi:CDP-glycerol glycerophosphotransferase